MKIDYSTVTELPDNKASQEQLARLFHRYHFASLYCEGKKVLEVACGAGIGLGYIAKVARRIIGGDIDENNLCLAKKHYNSKENIELQYLDAHKLPFADKSFDVVILYEAIYYLTAPEKFIQESYRLLKNKGVLILCTVNKDWSDFNPSPYSTKYWSVPELHQLLNSFFQEVEFYGAFLAKPNTWKGKIISFIKRKAVALNLIPKTMKGKEFFKRIFLGELKPIPVGLEDGMAEYHHPIPIPKDIPNDDYKVLYAVARVK